MNKNIAIFASGRGSNAKNIIEYFKNKDVDIKIIITDNKNAGVLEYAEEYKIPFLILTENELRAPELLIKKLQEFNIDLIVLAGYLKLIPVEILDAFKNKIINIHPALLPKYGGKGMYGMKVHKEVKKAGEQYTGITIHYVNEKYDEGEIIFQKEIKITTDDSPEDIADKVHSLEYKYYPVVIESLLNNS